MKKVFSLLVICLIVFAVLSCSDADIDTPDTEPVNTNNTVSATDETLSDVPNEPETLMLPELEVRVISMNLCYDQDNIKKRGELMIPLLLSFSPDSIGTQENGGLSEWQHILETGLPNYERVGICGDGNEDSSRINANYIYYNADKYRCLDWYTFWPSRTTQLIASSHSPTYPRTCTWAILEHIETGARYVHINCHLGFEYEEENIFQIKIIRDLILRFEELGLPVFTTGDFNTSEGSRSYQLITAPPQIGDPKHLAEKTMSSGTFRGWNYRDVSGGRPIDFCFVTEQMMEVHEYRVIDTYVDGVMLTDHLGIFTHATIHSLPDTITTPYKASTEGITVTEISRRAYVYQFSFTVAEDQFVIHEYQVEVIDESGNVVDLRKIPSLHMDEVTDEYKNCTLGGLEPGTRYTVNLYAVTLTGTRSEPITFEFTTKSTE